MFVCNRAVVVSERGSLRAFYTLFRFCLCTLGAYRIWVKSGTQRTRSGVMNLSWDIVRVHGHCIQQLVLETKLYVHGTHRSPFAVNCQCWSFLAPWLHLSSI
jgi:hypothetical protein